MDYETITIANLSAPIGDIKLGDTLTEIENEAIRKVFAFFTTLMFFLVFKSAWEYLYSDSVKYFHLPAICISAVYIGVTNWSMMFLVSLAAYTIMSALVCADVTPTIDEATVRYVFEWNTSLYTWTQYVVMSTTLLTLSAATMVNSDDVEAAEQLGFLEKARNAAICALIYALIGREIANLCYSRMALTDDSHQSPPCDTCLVCRQKLQCSDGCAACKDLHHGAEETDTTCRHLFHEKCIRNWVSIGTLTRCPYCNTCIEDSLVYRTWSQTWSQLYSKLLNYARFGVYSHMIGNISTVFYETQIYAKLFEMISTWIVLIILRYIYWRKSHIINMRIRWSKLW